MDAPSRARRRPPGNATRARRRPADSVRAPEHHVRQRRHEHAGSSTVSEPLFAGSGPFEVRLLLGVLVLTGIAGIVGVGLSFRRTPHADGDASLAAQERSVYRRLRNRYLAVYALATLGDWIQGGYIYALYAEYGYSLQQIALVFGVGYGSAATLGTYVGAVGDVGGHRRNCVAYGALYVASCLLCNVGDLSALAVGRLLGGIAYSILFTSFESWLIAEADACGLSQKRLSRLFSLATLCNASTAALAGILGHFAVEYLALSGGNRYAAPFNAATVPLTLASIIASLRWSERYGDQQTTAGVSLARSWSTIWRSRTLLTLGLVNSLYETALYVFVFLWTPSLERRAHHQIAHGLVFSIFMLCKMVGSQAFHAMSFVLAPTFCLALVFIGSMVALATPLFTESYDALLVAFCGFECLLGVYWPAIALLRSTEVDARAL